MNSLDIRALAGLLFLILAMAALIFLPAVTQTTGKRGFS